MKKKKRQQFFIFIFICNSRIQIGTLHTHTLPHSDWLHCHSAVGYMPAGYTLAAQQIPVVTVTEHRTAQPNRLLCTSWHHRTISPELHEIKILDIFFQIQWQNDLASDSEENKTLVIFQVLCECIKVTVTSNVCFLLLVGVVFCFGGGANTV